MNPVYTDMELDRQLGLLEAAELHASRDEAKRINEDIERILHHMEERAFDNWYENEAYTIEAMQETT